MVPAAASHISTLNLIYILNVEEMLCVQRLRRVIGEILFHCRSRCGLRLICILIDDLRNRIDDVSGYLVGNLLQDFYCAFLSVGVGQINGAYLTGTFLDRFQDLADIALLADLNTTQRVGYLLCCDGRRIIRCFQDAQVDQCLASVLANTCQQERCRLPERCSWLCRCFSAS